MRIDNDLLFSALASIDLEERRRKRLHDWRLKWYRLFGWLPRASNGHRQAQHGSLNVCKFPKYRRQLHHAATYKQPPTPEDAA